MIISTPRTDARRQAGFTLVEVMIAAALGSFVLAGVLSAFIFIARSGFRASSYSELESEVRRGMEIFARDARNASDLRWHSAQSITLTVNGSPVTYAYDSTSGSATYQCFYRQPGDTSSTQPRTALIHNLSSDFAFKRYKLEQSGVTDNTASNDLETKQLQLSLHPANTSRSMANTSQTAVSARYLLRNKRVAQ